MTADFLNWLALNERRLDGTPQQAAWLAWQARGDSREVAQRRLDAGADFVADHAVQSASYFPRSYPSAVSDEEARAKEQLWIENALNA